MPLVSRLPVPRAPQLGSSAQPRLIVRFAHATTSNESESPVPSLLRLDTTSTRADSLHPVFTVGASFSLARWLPLDTVGARHLVLLLGASFALPSCHRLEALTQVNTGELHLMIVRVAKLLIDHCSGDPADDLRVTSNHVYDLGPDLHVRPGTMLDASLTPLANGHGDLV